MDTKSFQFNQNSFDIIRYISAFSVMFLHYTYYAITVSGQAVQFLRGIRRITEFLPGVVILFSLSGFLISASFERCGTKKEFFIKRIFRLYPELWVCTIVNVCVIFVLAREYLDSSILIWLVTQIVGIANTPGCLNQFATGSVNGALWTIFTEIQLYIFLGLAYNWLKKLGNVGWSVVLIGSVGLNLFCDYVSKSFEGIAAKLIERILLPYLIWFLIGVFCYQKRYSIILILKKYLWILIIVFGVNQYIGLCQYGYYEDIVTGIFLPLITIGIAYTLPAAKIKCDLSYGMFLYHWIVLNIIIDLDLFITLPWYASGLLFIAVTLVLAWLSWYLIGRNTKKIIGMIFPGKGNFK